MNFKDLENKVMKELKDRKFGGKYAVKVELKEAIEKVMRENGVEGAYAHFELGDKDNVLRILPVGRRLNESFWPVYVLYKVSRKLISSSYNEGNTYEFTLKQLVIQGQMRLVEGDNVIEIKTIEDYLRAEDYELARRKNKQESEKATLKKFMEENPDFIKMMELYYKYKDQLN